MQTWLRNAMAEEMARATLDHGPMTDDPCRAVAILTEEVGEVANAVLELDRIRRRHERLFGAEDRRGTLVANLAAQRGQAVHELVQVMAVAALLAEKLLAAGAVDACGPAVSVV